MKTIYKYPLMHTGFNYIEIPKEGQILSVGLDPHNSLCIWALVDPESERVDRRFYVAGTGWGIPDEVLADNRWTFLGTTLDQESNLIWHTFVEDNDLW